MPRLPIDYSKTVIYKIVHEDDYDNNNVYVGHTTDFIKRKYGHKTSCNNPNDRNYNQVKYQYIRENNGWDCFKMIEIEKYPCKDENEARAREEHWRCTFNANLNAIKCFRTPEETLEYQKQYNQDNADKRAEYKKQYRQENCDKIKENTKQYYQKNTDKILEKHKQYRKDNVDKINEKVICECCGFNCIKYNLKKHQKTAKCIKAKEALETIV
jgi:hypothetical protein